MNLILYSSDGKSIRDSMKQMTYNYMRSHHYIIFKLARELGITKILDGFPGITQEIVPGSDVYYTLKEFAEYNLTSPALTDYKDSIAVLFFAYINKTSYPKVLKAISSSPYFIYYCSDPEFNKDYPGDGTDLLLKFVRNHPEDPISKYFNSRCIAICTGFHFMIDQITSYFDKPVIYIPQIINPNIPIIESEKMYDVWMINTTPSHKYIADKFRDLGFSVLALTRNKDYCEGIDYIECTQAGLNLDILLSAVSMCKYYFGSYPFQEISDQEMLRRYSTWNHTSKVLESYYANTYWISSNKTLENCIDLIKSDQWKRQKLFNEYIHDNYSFKTYEREFKYLVEIIKDAIK